MEYPRFAAKKYRLANFRFFFHDYQTEEIPAEFLQVCSHWDIDWVNLEISNFPNLKSIEWKYQIENVYEPNRYNGMNSIYIYDTL